MAHKTASTYRVTKPVHLILPKRPRILFLYRTDKQSGRFYCHPSSLSPSSFARDSDFAVVRVGITTTKIETNEQQREEAPTGD